MTIFKGHKSAVWRVAFSPDGQTIASASGDFSIKLWQLDGTLIRTLKHERGVWGIAFSLDGHTIKVWKIDGTLLVTLNGHTSNVSSVAFSPDGKTLASGGDDQLVIMWDLEQILHLNLLKYTCDWVRDYLKTNITVEKSDRSICNYSLFHCKRSN
ncbi:WD40 repeat domain-containing protein [Nostoc sp. 'Peltigera membranacea cyanobiont' 210A]|uniref:WD40 repeat domain-containing protein n=1 Tax=Nostoc sp. 'Peltigera membranacea cyanobiont' 210A TaxID=2014529 RepID=UPI00167D1782|nr:PD40 domain-containing protein [Nostoc sp. 'Peltigera membranacea cyanobiont' 210A]